MNQGCLEEGGEFGLVQWTDQVRHEVSRGPGPDHCHEELLALFRRQSLEGILLELVWEQSAWPCRLKKEKTRSQRWSRREEVPGQAGRSCGEGELVARRNAGSTQGRDAPFCAQACGALCPNKPDRLGTWVRLPSLWGRAKEPGHRGWHRAEGAGHVPQLGSRRERRGQLREGNGPRPSPTPALRPLPPGSSSCPRMTKHCSEPASLLLAMNDRGLPGLRANQGSCRAEQKPHSRELCCEAHCPQRGLGKVGLGYGQGQHTCMVMAPMFSPTAC